MDKQTYRIGNMDCASCAREVEDGVARLNGVEHVEVNFATTKMIIDGVVDVDLLRARVESLGKTLKEESIGSTNEASGDVTFWRYVLDRSEMRLALIGIVLVTGVLILDALWGISEDLVAVVLTAAMLVAVFPIALSGFNSLRISRRVNINTLMTVAALGAVAIGEHLEAFVVIVLFSLGEALEGFAAVRARRSLAALMELKPEEALLLTGDGEVAVPVVQLAVGDHVLIKPGERVPMDGRIVSGNSSIDESTITGESIPVAKGLDAEVFAGTLNGRGTLTVEVTCLVQDNTISRIIQMVEDAQSRRAPIHRVVDQFAEIYTPLVMAIAFAIAIVPPLMFDAPFWDTGDTHGWLYRALAMLVIACPCSLVISTPVTIISAITGAARQGIVIKGGVFLEIIGKLQAIAFDKTGTLTRGQPVVQMIRSVDCAGNDQCGECQDVLGMAAAVERYSTHPLAKAIILESQQHPSTRAFAASDVSVMAKHGVQGVIDGHEVTLGSHSIFDTQFPHEPAFCQSVENAEGKGQTTVLVHDGERVRGFIGVSDESRNEARTALEELDALDLHTIMLTGDNERAAGAVGAQLGIRQIEANLYPEDKVARIQELVQQFGTVAMVGDGVNDTPALAAASVGIAMGGAGSAQALETADVVLMSDNLRRLPYLIRLARFVRRLIRQNIAITFGVKLLFLSLAVFGWTTLWLAILADVGMALLVTINGMRPLRFG